MVQAIVDICADANYVINLIKAKYGLKDKSEAIDRLAAEYARDNLDFELRPEYVKRLREIEKESKVKVKDAHGYFASMRE
jgi:hypothetical protein